MEKFVGTLRWNICILETDITSGESDGPPSHLVVKEGGCAKPTSRGEGVLVMALSHKTKDLDAARSMDTLFPAFLCHRRSLCMDVFRQRWPRAWLPWAWLVLFISAVLEVTETAAALCTLSLKSHWIRNSPCWLTVPICRGSWRYLHQEVCVGPGVVDGVGSRVWVVAFPQEQVVHWADLGVFGQVG